MQYDLDIDNFCCAFTLSQLCVGPCVRAFCVCVCVCVCVWSMCVYKTEGCESQHDS